MAGHSKWANIRHKKGANDAKRAKIYTKLIKELTVATKEGGEDPSANPRLRLAIQNAKGANMPKDTIERAIKKSSSSSAETYETVVYEGTAQGVALIVECMTDNINRTVSNVRAAFSRGGGSLGKKGTVSYLFKLSGVFELEEGKVGDRDEFDLAMIDAGADEIDSEEGRIYIVCAKENFGDIQKALDEMELEATSANLEYIPMDRVTIEEGPKEKVLKF